MEQMERFATYLAAQDDSQTCALVGNGRFAIVKTTAAGFVPQFCGFLTVEDAEMFVVYLMARNRKPESRSGAWTMMNYYLGNGFTPPIPEPVAEPVNYLIVALEPAMSQTSIRKALGGA